MAVAVKTTASKARAMDGREALFCDAIEYTPLGVSKSSVQVELAEVPRSKSDGPGSVKEQEHCTKDSLWLASLLSYTLLVCGSAMKIDSANAQPMGRLIYEGGHKPFHALACPLKPCLLYTSPSPRDATLSRMPSSA